MMSMMVRRDAGEQKRRTWTDDVDVERRRLAGKADENVKRR